MARWPHHTGKVWVECSNLKTPTRTGGAMGRGLRNPCAVNELADEKGWCHCEVRKAICGLAQSGHLAFKQLEKNLEAEGCSQSKRAPGLWLRKTRDESFTLAVDGRVQQLRILRLHHPSTTTTTKGRLFENRRVLLIMSSDRRCPHKQTPSTLGVDGNTCVLTL